MYLCCTLFSTRGPIVVNSISFRPRKRLPDDWITHSHLAQAGNIPDDSTAHAQSIRIVHMAVDHRPCTCNLYVHEPWYIVHVPIT